MAQPLTNLAIALLHYPVYNKHREVVTTALTNRAKLAIYMTMASSEYLVQR